MSRVLFAGGSFGKTDDETIEEAIEYAGRNEATATVHEGGIWHPGHCGPDCPKPPGAAP